MTTPSAKFTPTRACPHRLCATTHLVTAAMALIFIAPMLFGGFTAFAYLAASMLIGYAAFRIVHGRPLSEVVADDLAQSSSQLVVRPAWAIIAAGMDLVFLAASTFAAATVITDPSAAKISGGGVGDSRRPAHRRFGSRFQGVRAPAGDPAGSGEARDGAGRIGVLTCRS